MRPTGSASELKERRLEAARLLERGETVRSVADAVGADERSVRRWKAALKTAGPQGLEPKPSYGRPSKLGLTARLRIMERLEVEARAAGSSNTRLTHAKVAELIQQEFGVTYHPNSIGRLMAGPPLADINKANLPQS